MNNFQYKLFKLECFFRRLKRKLTDKNEYIEVYVFLIPSIHKHEGDYYDEYTVVTTHEERIRIQNLCKEKDCYCMEKKEKMPNTMHLRGYVDYFETIGRLNNLRER